MKELGKSDKENYLKFGNLSQPFLEKDYVEEMVMRDYKSKNPEQNTIFESLNRWIKFKLKMGKDKEKNCKFSRTAKEIWESGFITGCTDIALVFACFARQLGYPTTLLHTAEENWLQRFQSGGDYRLHQGHTFCEVFYKDKWILVDPMRNEVMFDYNADKINLPYSLGGNSVFVPYRRCIDFEKPQTVKAHNEIMDELCKNIQL